MSALELREVLEEESFSARPRSSRGIWARMRKTAETDLRAARQEDRDLTLALARVRSLDPERRESVFRADSLTLTHWLAARLEEPFAPALGLPPWENELVFATQMKGTLGSSDARLDWHWERSGRTEAGSAPGGDPVSRRAKSSAAPHICAFGSH